ncbi:MAG: VWA domain-containing protein [Planctomycetota bacterium]|nr:VWA domain-containing protein [Planctomycetota bacterium]
MALLATCLMLLNTTMTSLPDQFEEARVALMSSLQERNESAICDAIEALGAQDQQNSAELMLRYGLPHESLLVHEESLRLLRTFVSEGAREAVRTVVRKSKDVSRRIDALRVVRAWPQSRSRPELLYCLEDRSWIVVAHAVRGLHDHRAKEVVGALIDRMPAAKGRLLEDISDALTQLTSQSHGHDAADWRLWWRDSRSDWEPPEVKPSSDEVEEKSLGTAVRQGLYGEIVSERVVFLLDISGSMLAETSVGGSRIEVARTELCRALESGLSPKSRFSVVAFSEGVLRFSTKLVKARGSSLKKAIQFVQQLRAGGETNSYGALEAAFADREVDTIYLLSDGSPTVGDETSQTLILDAVRKWNRYRATRIHCFGLFAGEAPRQDEGQARDFLRRLARSNHGRYTEIR